MSEKTYTPGKFVWRELATTSIEKSQGFYGELLNWKIEKSSSVSGMDYWEMKVDGRSVGGMFAAPEGVPAHWSSYVSVADVDGAIAAAKAHGGTVLSGPHTIPSVGTMAAVRDPQGAVFSVFKSAFGDPPATGMPALGDFCWEELATTDIAASKAFYGAVAGWKIVNFFGMEIFGVSSTMEGGVASFREPPPGVPAHWLTNVVVGSMKDPNSLTQANAKVARLGGKVLMDRIDVPNVGSISVVQDNVGAHIALFFAAPR